ncbi:hypothetical protein GQ457_01G023190 [Hibiscus cannabinus]
MKVYLRSLGLWNAVETDEDPPALRANPTLAQLKAYNEDLLKKDIALTCINSRLAYHIFTSIMDLETPKSVWNKLKEIHKGGDKVKKTKLLTLKIDFSILQMKADELIKDFSNRLMDVVNQIRLYGENIPDAKVVEKVMISVPKKLKQKFQLLRNLVSEGVFLAAHKGVKFNNSLKKAESSNKSKGFFPSASGLNGKFPPCPICKKTNHAEKDCRFKEKGKSKFQCIFCGKSGHTENGCTSHMTPVTAYFSSLDKSFETSMKMENDVTVKVHGKRSISVNTPKANMKLELVHSDLCGPMKTPSMNDKFKIFAENQSDCKQKVLRTDNGGEYKHGLMPISEELVITEDAENGETSVWFDVAGTTDVDEVIKTKSLVSVYERCNLVFAEPTSFDAAAKVSEWIDAMKSEISAIEKNDTWFLTYLPSGKHVIGGVDYGDTFSHVAKLDTIRLLIAIAGQLGWNVFHLDVKSGFLNGELEDDIYVCQPEGFVVPGIEHQVYKLKRSLYGLKQAPRAWYYRIDSYLQKLGFQRSVNEATLYLKKDNNANLLVISLCVDDLLVMGSNGKAFSKFKLSMQKEFEMFDLGLMSYFLEMKINQSMAGIFISQNKYALDVLRKFKLESCKGVDSPLPSNLKLSKNNVAKRVLKYVKSTLGEGLNYLKMDNVVLTGYSDIDWAWSLDDMKSTSGYVFNLGSGAICWSSKKQQVVAQSITEAEYIVVDAAVNQALWLRNFLSDLGFKQESAIVLLCDNKSAIAIAENPVQHGRTKHINVKYHAIREAEKNSLIKMEFCSSKMQVAVLMAKALSSNRILFLKHDLSITNINLKVEC